MISSLLFVIVLLLLASWTPRLGADQASAWHGLESGLVAVAIAFGWICFQNLWGRRFFPKFEVRLFLANFVLIGALTLFQLLFQSSRVLFYIPYLGTWTTLHALLPLFFYFLGLWIFFLTSEKSRDFGREQLGLRLPFILPFLVFSFVYDLGVFLNSGAWWGFLLLATALLFMLIFPELIVKFWSCRPLEESALKETLEGLCQEAGFKHHGLLRWDLMRSSMTAAIIGFIPRFRYILFTPYLLQRLRVEEIKAVLAHEIGHSARKHLLFYPFILLGITPLLVLYEKSFPILGRYPLWNFLSEAVLVLLYLRFLFGYFSRLFERQADLHIFALGLDPRDLSSALQRLALFSGEPADKANWHHYSVQQRVDFLAAAELEPWRIQKHHDWVKYSLSLYVCLLIFLFFAASRA